MFPLGRNSVISLSVLLIFHSYDHLILLNFCKLHTFLKNFLTWLFLFYNLKLWALEQTYGVIWKFLVEVALVIWLLLNFCNYWHWFWLIMILTMNYFFISLWLIMICPVLLKLRFYYFSCRLTILLLLLTNNCGASWLKIHSLTLNLICIYLVQR